MSDRSGNNLLGAFCAVVVACAVLGGAHASPNGATTAAQVPPMLLDLPSAAPVQPLSLPGAPAKPAPAPPRPAPPSVASGPGVVYSFAQLEQALAAAGVAQPAVGAAIAEAESSGRSDAVCDDCAGVSEYSVGPWQINLRAHPGVTSACAMSLNCAAGAVRAISSGGTNWTPWTTYTSGKWRAYSGG